MSYRDRLAEIATKDADVLIRKDKEYGGSWLKRGGVGAFMMLARKWDRLEQAMTVVKTRWEPKPEWYEGSQNGISHDEGHEVPLDKYDVIERALADGREEGILDDIGDLRRYLLLVEAEIRERMSA